VTAGGTLLTVRQNLRRPPTVAALACIIESLPLEIMETADVSPIAVMNDERKCLSLFVSGQNRTQEADGSIPFSSTIFLRFISLTHRFGTLFFQSFRNSRSFRRPAAHLATP
jgi:hypothetical protein